ncbi:hypothetical protein [Asticcacaulis excentricus]|uniref:TolA protein n=1 Tax=Asticcacaulis excentricus TaxID=78587 RepID=A0A3G9G3Y9_9CAUL|nr:hypothetical protein [Asticcacaulis excentricus]BBF81386.1 TolA protein [Asticcacaulis excentricus]
MDNQSRTCVFTTCFLGAPDPVYDAFSTLGHYLRQYGVELVLFSCRGDFSAYDGFTLYRIPFSLRENGQLFQHAVSASGPALSGAMLQELMTLDREWVGDDTPFAAEVYIQRAFTYWQKAVEILRPCAVISWGTTAPFSRLMMRLGQLNQLPLYVMERGWLQDTLGLTVLGQGHMANICTDISRLYDDVPEEGQKEHWAQIHSYYTHTRHQHYPSHNQSIADETVIRLREQSGLKILYLGSNDAGGGNSLKGVNQSERASTWASTSYNAAAELAAAIEQLDMECQLWIKPHPSTDFRLPEGSLGGQIDYFRTENVQQLVEMADLVVTLGSTAQIYGLLYDKPFLVMGNSILMGRRIAYEALSREDLLPSLKQALARESLSERLAAGKALVTRMYLGDVIGLNSEVPTRLKVADLASFLARFRTLAIDTSLKMTERRDRFDAFTAIASGGASNDDPEYLKKQLVDQADSLKEQTLLVETLRTEISRLECEVAKYDQIASKLHEENQKQVDALLRTASDMDHLRQKYDTLVKTSGALESEKQALEQENIRHLSDLEALRIDAESTTKAHKLMLADAQKTHIAEQKSLQARIETLGTELRTETVRHAERLKDERQKTEISFKSQIADLKAEHKAQTDTLNRLVTQLKAEATALETQHAKTLKSQQQRADDAAKAHETAVQNLKEAFENERAILTNQIDAKTNELKAAEAAATRHLSDLKAEHKAQTDTLNRLVTQLKAEATALETQHAKTLKSQQQRADDAAKAHETAVQNLKEAFENERAILTNQIDAKTNELKAAEAAATRHLSDLKAEHKAQTDTLNRLVTQLKAEATALETQHAKTLKSQQQRADDAAKAHETAVQNLKEAFENERAILTNQIDAKTNELKAAEAAATRHLSDLKAEHKAQTDTLNRLVTQLKAEATALETQHAKTLKSQQQRADDAAKAHETAVQNLKEAFENERAILTKQIDAKTNELKAVEAAATQRLQTAQNVASKHHHDLQTLLDDLKASYAAERTDLNKQITSLKRSQDALKLNHEKALQRQSIQYESQITDLRVSLENLRTSHADESNQRQIQFSNLENQLAEAVAHRTRLSDALATQSQLVESYRAGRASDYLQWAFNKSKRI